ncbi:MAG: PKD domain-containing protein [Candidatus Eisenbacteria bacterium]
MSDKRGFAVIELMIVFMITNIPTAVAVPNFINMQDGAKEVMVVANMCTVQLAFEDFAVQSDGTYPTADSDVLPDGKIFIDLLPDWDNDGMGEFPKNPFTGVDATFIWGADPCTAGDMGNNPPNGDMATNYAIKGCDADGNLLPLELTPDAGPPVAYFVAEPVSGTSPLQVSFTDASCGNIHARHWDFGDGSQFDGQNPPTQTYETELCDEQFTAILTVTGPFGSDDYFTVIHVQNPASNTEVATWGAIKATYK